MAQRLLFGGTQGSSSQSKYLVEFKAGKCTQKGKLVTPDKRKGLVYIQQTDDSLIHFCWKDRTTGQTEEDLIMFPGDAEFEKVTQCTTGRVFVLKFKSNNKHCFYWMQEPKTDKDDDFKTKVNQFLNDPSTQQRSSNNFAELSDDHDLSSLISGMSSSELAQLFRGLGGSPNLFPLGSGRNRASRATHDEAMDTETPAAATPTTAGSGKSTTKVGSAAKGAGIKAQNLAEILNKVNAEVASGSGGSSSHQADSLKDLLTHSEVLEPIISNKELMARVKDFLPQVGGEEASSETAEQLSGTVRTPQFAQAVSMFSAALASGQMGPLMTQFGMSADVATAAATGNIEEFVKALEKSQKKPESTDAEMKE
ncbi:proteasomal ubiquitin receptor ADRM1-B [Galendromus occidentalis]|uniref:Proteasomal ubiquitin receptor ADRM1 homolog n=1 Tax=Galendromus occidentalis TaxID=34638 RepID=A0AAJ6W0E6_9ACAR|nr:proteasomal ubiquitin receptor ADRM1-B [Galendromus occidentalis]